MQVLFRAKEKNSNNYVIGYEYYNHVEDEYYITHYVSGSNYKVDRTTRSINIEDMLDSQGNKIFASLQEDGKGGDILQYKDKHYYCNNTSYIFIFNIIYSKEYNALCVREIDEEKELDFFYELPTFIKEGLKIIGIQQ